MNVYVLLNKAVRQLFFHCWQRVFSSCCEIHIMLSRSKTWDYGLPLSGIPCSNSVGSMDVSAMCCQVEVFRDEPITLPEESYREWRVCVWSRNFNNGSV